MNPIANNNAGHPLVKWPNWITNQARNNGADIWPTPFVPVHHQYSGAAMQVQLSNGWELTNYGKKETYQDYLALLTGSASYGGARQGMLPGKKVTGQTIPSDLQLMNAINAASQTSQTSGTGQSATGVDISAQSRGYYG